MFDPEERETNYLTDLQIVPEDLGVGPEGAEILARMDLPTRRTNWWGKTAKI